MPKIIQTKFHSSDGLKYSHAYDEFGTYLSIESAVNISSRKWYLYPDSQVELLLAAVNSQGQRTHWRARQNQSVTINGVTNQALDGRILTKSCITSLTPYWQ